MCLSPNKAFRHHPYPKSSSIWPKKAKNDLRKAKNQTGCSEPRHGQQIFYMSQEDISINQGNETTPSSVINSEELIPTAPSHREAAEVNSTFISDTKDEIQPTNNQQRRYFKGYSVVPGTMKTHNTVILEAALQYMVDYQVKPNI